MDRDRAGAILARKMQELQLCSYRYFVLMIQQRPVVVYEVKDEQVDYQIEVTACFDGGQEGSIRVVGSIDDGGMLSSLTPVTQSFLLTRDGVIVEKSPG